MKNEILDEPFHNSFSDFLEKEEVIHWVDKPNLKMKYPWKQRIVIMILSILMIFISLGPYSDIEKWWHRIIILIIIVLVFYISLWTQKKDIE